MYDRTKLKVAVVEFCEKCETGSVGPGDNTSPAAVRAMKETQTELRSLLQAGEVLNFPNGPAKFKGKKIESAPALADAMGVPIGRFERTKCSYKLSRAIVEAMKCLKKAL